MKVKIQDNFNGEITEEEITPIYRCHHVNDRKYYPTLNDVEFDETSEYILIENPDSCYGFSALWLKDRKNKMKLWNRECHGNFSFSLYIHILKYFKLFILKSL